MNHRNLAEPNEWKVQREIVGDYLSRFVRALVVSGRGSSLEAYASCVAATYKGHPVLLTAKHVLDDLASRRLFVEGESDFHHVMLRPEIVNVDEDADAAVIMLHGDAFGWGVDLLVLDDQFEPQIRDGEVEIFLSAGFPWRETELNFQNRTLEIKVVRYWAFEDSTAYGLLRRSRADLIITSFDTKNAYRDGHVQQMKAPHGMSGGALWRLWGPTTEYPSLARGGLAGIMTEYQTTPTKCMISARIGVFQRLASELV
jgi:hypothetical protein